MLPKKLIFEPVIILCCSGWWVALFQLNFRGNKKANKKNSETVQWYGMVWWKLSGAAIAKDNMVTTGNLPSRPMGDLGFC